ncbi:MAG TPA: transposase [Kiritimatiellia bacterium]|nr:transposase [Kiritimatiellia bacterium]HMO99722.1 transposase [Kiritimatiellia bacterium]HMP97421.1 transposase [Kiritimatiellia bacterium]
MTSENAPKHPDLPPGPRRLRRLAEVWTSRGRPLFFVTICTHERHRWLASKEILDAFINFCGQSPTKAQVWVGSFVLMPDHLHMFVSAEGSQHLSRWVGSLKGFLSSRKRALGIPGEAWQEGFFDHLLRDTESYSEKWAYVRLNPVRAGLVEKPEQWPFMGEVHRIAW